MSLKTILNWRYLSVALALAFLSPAAGQSAAGTSDFSYITVVLPDSGGFFFNSSGARGSAPASATIPNRWVINTTTSQGQAMVAALLSAYMAHKRIMVVGTGNCAVWGDTETVNYFQIED